MWLNILIAAVVGLLAYGATLYFNHTQQPNIVTQPDASALIEPQEGAQAPDFTFTDTKEQTHNLRDFTGQIVLLNFWASWCAPCIKEFPALINLVQNNDNVLLLALSADLEEDAMLRFIEKFRQQGLDVDHGRVLIGLDQDSKVMRSIYQTFQMPETYIIDADQTLIHKVIGADWQEEDLQIILNGLN